MKKRECSCSSCNSNCMDNVINLNEYTNTDEMVREKANIITYSNTLVSEKVEDKGIDTGMKFYHKNNIPFKIQYENLSFIISSFTVYDNINEIRFYDEKDNSITRLNIENKTAMITEVKSDSSNDFTFVLEIDDFVYLDHDENKFPRIRSEFYTSINEGENLFIVNIYLKPSSQSKELLVYKLELPNMTREEAMFISHNYIHSLESIKDILRIVSIRDNSYIAGPDTITKIEGFAYGGLLIDTGELVPYHYLGNLLNSSVIFDRTLYISYTDFSIKTNNGKYIELTDDEMELVLDIVTKFKELGDSTNEYTLDQVEKEYDEVSKKLNELFPNSDTDEDISIILNDEGEFTVLSLFQYRELLLQSFREKE